MRYLFKYFLVVSFKGFRKNTMLCIKSSCYKQLNKKQTISNISCLEPTTHKTKQPPKQVFLCVFAIHCQSLLQYSTYPIIGSFSHLVAKMDTFATEFWEDDLHDQKLPQTLD